MYENMMWYLKLREYIYITLRISSREYYNTKKEKKYDGFFNYPIVSLCHHISLSVSLSIYISNEFVLCFLSCERTQNIV